MRAEIIKLEKRKKRKINKTKVGSLQRLLKLVNY